MGKSLSSIEDALAGSPQSSHCAIGDIVARRELYNAFDQDKWTPVIVIAPSACISRSAEIEAGRYVGTRAVINAEAKVGKNTIINTAALIEHDCVIGEHTNISPVPYCVARQQLEVDP